MKKRLAHNTFVGWGPTALQEERQSRKIVSVIDIECSDHPKNGGFQKQGVVFPGKPQLPHYAEKPTYFLPASSARSDLREAATASSSHRSFSG